MSFESFVAARYLRTRKGSAFLSFMTLTAIGSVAVGTAALIITFAILDGFEREIRTNLVGLSGHIRVGVFRNATVPDLPEYRARLGAIPAVGAAHPFLERQAMMIAHGSIDGVLVKGIRPDALFPAFDRKIVAGSASLDSAAGRPAILLSRRMGEKLGARPGDNIVLIDAEAADFSGTPKLVCAVAGWYETGMAEYLDDLYVFVPLEAAQSLFRMRGKISGYDVLCRDADAVDATVKRIDAELGYPFNPRSVASVYQNLFVWIALQRKLIPVVVGSLTVIAVFNVITVLLLFVMEKTSEIGILISLGTRRRSIRNIFILQGGLIGAAGILIGAGLAFLLCLLQQELHLISLPQGVYYMTSVPIRMTPAAFGLVSGAALLLCLATSFIPAWLAARLHPVAAIRFR